MRANKIIPEGKLKVRFVELMNPFADIVVRRKMKGSLIVATIENGLSAYPKYEGRFPCISGLKCKFDPERPP